MSDVNNTIESGKTGESTKFSKEFEIQILSQLEKLIPKDVQKVQLVEPPRKQGAPRVGRAVTTATVKNDAGDPNIEIRNPFDRKARVMGITLIPDDSFKTKGIVQLDISRAPYLPAITAGDFTNVDTFAVPISDKGHEIEPNETIEIYMWTSDATSSALTAVVYFEG